MGSKTRKIEIKKSLKIACIISFCSASKIRMTTSKAKCSNSLP